MSHLSFPSRPLKPVCLALVAGFVLGGLNFAQAAQHALLIGCTKYENENIPALYGPRNDVPAMTRLLCERFGFPEANIRQLYDWPDDASRRPTRANIAAEFAKLAGAGGAQSGDQVVIYMSGHGTQCPLPRWQQNPLDPKNPEPDGLDEVFLPSDAKSWSGDELSNSIRDDEIGEWLDMLRNKGAHVWIIFDCCHSGTMTRAAGPSEDNPAEIQRAVNPESLGIPTDLLKVRVATVGEGGPGRVEESTLELEKGELVSGSVVAFYAAQSFETAPDLPRPMGAARVPENFFGLLTYNIGQTLLQQKSPLTYRDLSRCVVSLYRAERGSRGPTPLFAGDLDREVLGLNKWPTPSPVILERKEGKLRVSGGEALGITENSILAVLRAGAAPGANDAAVGYVRVSHATSMNAVVEPCAFNGQDAMDPAALPDLAHCKMVAQNVGDMRIKLCIGSSPEALKGLDETIAAAMAKLPPEIQSLLDVRADPRQSDFELRPVTAEMALKEFNIQTREPTLLLLEAGGPGRPADQVGVERPANDAFRVHTRYDLNNALSLALELERDLKKIYKWRNLWRIAGKTNLRLGGDNDLKLEVALIRDEQDTSGGELLKKSYLPDGQSFEVRLVNNGQQDYWVTVLFLSADYGIVPWYDEAIGRKNPCPPLPSTIDGSSFGPEGLVVFAMPVRGVRFPPPFADVLKQEPFGKLDRGGVRAVPQNSFGRLLAAAAYESGSRSAIVDDPSNPIILTWSWITLPKRGHK